jgi:tRNA threonylcarbamoyladenosine biosynthesis protein TsaE
VVIALRGDLGAGKTTLAQGFLRELGVTQNVISPTFLIMRPYEIATGGYRRVVHIDCYRLARAEELLALGLRDFLAAPDTILLIEWPEIVADLLPKGATRVSIEHPQAGTTRTVIVS